MIFEITFIIASLFQTYIYYLFKRMFLPGKGRTKKSFWRLFYLFCGNNNCVFDF